MKKYTDECYQFGMDGEYFAGFFCFVFKLASFNANWNVLTNYEWVNSMAWVIFHDRSME